jgi:class 3 adenylate cyclase
VESKNVSSGNSGLSASLRFRDADLEREFQARYFRDNVGYVRAALVLAIVAWAFFALVSAPATGHETYLLIHLVGIGAAALCLGLSFTSGYARWWQMAIVAVVLMSAALSQMHRTVAGHPADWGGVVGLMMVLAFAYAFFRLQFRYAALAGLFAIVWYNAARGLVKAPGDIGLFEPDVDLIVFATIGTAAAFALERFARLLFLRERDVDRERRRGDALLRNILPGTIIDRLKVRGPRLDDTLIAERYAEASVLFVDLVGFTEQAARTDPDELIATLDGVFSRWDDLADQFGLEKIKTIGDAYMAVAGVPDARADHAEATANMSLEIRDGVSQLLWPSGVPMSVRIGIACGPVIAGVIGHRKFAYDIWGDTVNAASRLESAAVPGSIQVSDGVHDRLIGNYAFSEPYMVELKGKGATTAYRLLGRTPMEGSAGRRATGLAMSHLSA